MGVTTSVEAFVYLAEGRSKVVKPILVSEGFDFDDATILRRNVLACRKCEHCRKLGFEKRLCHKS